jgi:hypothetical protein
MAHQNPNTANIPNEFDTAGKRKLLGKELRSLYGARLRIDYSLGLTQKAFSYVSLLI